MDEEQLLKGIESLLAGKEIGVSLCLLKKVEKRLIYKSKLRKYNKRFPQFVPFLENWFVFTDRFSGCLFQLPTNSS